MKQYHQRSGSAVAVFVVWMHEKSNITTLYSSVKRSIVYTIDNAQSTSTKSSLRTKICSGEIVYRHQAPNRYITHKHESHTIFLPAKPNFQFVQNEPGALLTQIIADIPTYAYLPIFCVKSLWTGTKMAWECKFFFLEIRHVPTERTESLSIRNRDCIRSSIWMPFGVSLAEEYQIKCMICVAISLDTLFNPLGL